MKKSRICALFALILTFIFSCTALIVPTLMKYISDVGVFWDGEQNIDFTVDSMIEVTNQEELFSALNNGYPFIKLSKDIENPLIIMDEAQNLYHDLILDLNGIEIQRNGHDPILNIKSGVRLTVTDNSEEQTGGLYNPVGSVFNIDGGTITVARGTFESGPRYSEYYSYNSEILDNSATSTTKRTLVSGAKEVVYNKGGVQTFVTAPIIQSYPTETKDIIYNHGNLYFDTDLEGIGGVNFTNPINADTYCFYQTSEDAAYTSSVPKDADWYYTYYVTTADNAYFSSTLTADEEASGLYTKITIYGYEDVIYEAAQKSEQSTYYAAIKMQAGSGKLDIQEGKFFSFFGVPTTAAVNAMGGSINVKKGEFSSRIPDAEIVEDDAVSAKENDFDAFNAEYFNNFKWANDTFSDGAIARKGESYCILNSGDAEVNIIEGTFYSSNNNIISMNGGSLSVSKGSFTKNNTIELSAKKDASAAVYMNNGILSLDNADFSVYGDYTSGVQIQDGKISISNSSCKIEGSHTYGIYSTVSGDDNFTVTDTDFAFTGKDGAVGDVQIGLYAENGKVTLSSSTGSTVSITGTLSKAVFAANSSTVKSEGYNYNLTGEQSECIHSTGGNVEVIGGKIELSGESSAGIYSTGGDVDSSNVSLLLEGATSVGIYSTGGTVKADNGCSITLSSNQSCYGIYAVSLDNDKPVDIQMDDATIKVGNTTANDDAGNAKTGSVLASVGAFLHSNNSASQIILNKSHIYSNELGIAVNGGNLICTGGGTVSAYNGSAVVVKGGNVVFGSVDSSGDEEFTVTSAINYDNATTRLSHAYELLLQEITDSISNPTILNYVNNDGIYITDGTFTCYSGLNYTFTGLYNDNQSETTVYKPLENLVKSYAVYVTTSTAQADTVNTKNFVMYKGTITSVYGGGIHVKGGNVVLGKEGSTESDTNTLLSIITKGTAVYSGSITSHNGTALETWSYQVSQNGGHAVKVEGGDLDIYYGSFIAARGNALFITDGNVDVTKGNFVGGALPETITETISQDATNNADTTYLGPNGGNGNSGLGCFYGLVLTNSGHLTVYNGNFLGQNGGAIFYGGTSENGCVADIKSGNFLSNKISSGINGLTGLCGISVCANTTLTLGAGVKVNAYNAAICIEYNTYLTGKYENVNVTVNGGEYITSNVAVVFDANGNGSSTRTTWTINGGHFQTASDKPIFNSQWGSYGAVWSAMLGETYRAYYYNGTTYTDISDQLSSSSSYNDVYISNVDLTA